MHERTWVSAHISHTGPQDVLLTGLVRPLLGELAAERLVDSYVFQRGLAHLRLGLRATGGSGASGGRAEEIRRLVRARCRRFFAVAAAPRPVAGVKGQPPPGPDRMTAAAGVGGAANALTFVPHRPHPQGAVEDHYALCSRTALRLISAGLPPEERDMVAFSLILTSWFLVEPDLARLARQPFVRGEPPEREPEPEPGPELWRRALRTAAAQVWATAESVTSGRTPGDVLGRWAASLNAVPIEGAERVFNSCAHLACNRLGTDWDGERRLRRLAARAVTELAA
ncbi:lantibiotic dehydratase C-terminal domain-containing protein [Streptomyces sp. 6N223]|uniref:lantibiotic dehydratase C-terminal domain-containing protein n=1 Tax=Streptomyces sp. 6N223 TaxID=3457412 RepID=UPI003FD5A71E